MFIGSEGSGKSKLVEALNYQFKFSNFLGSGAQEEVSFKRKTGKTLQMRKHLIFGLLMEIRRFK